MTIPVDDNYHTSWTDVLSAAGSSVVRLSLLFGSAAVALTFILTPMAETQVARATGIDQIATGSTQPKVRSLQTKQNYTLRRSVLQKDKNDVCIIGSDGVRNGSC